MKKAIIYARTSSSGAVENRQCTLRQVEDLKVYAGNNSLNVVEVFEEHISGAKKNTDRPVLQECIAYAIANSVEVVLFSELSRCGRAVWEVLDTIRTLKDNKVNAYFLKEGLSLFDTEGKENPYLAVMVSVLGVCAQIERDNISYRLNSGRTLAIQKGVKMGRKAGSIKSKNKKMSEYKEAIGLLKKGVSVRKTAELCKVSASTIQRLKKEFNL